MLDPSCCILQMHITGLDLLKEGMGVTFQDLSLALLCSPVCSTNSSLPLLLSLVTTKLTWRDLGCCHNFSYPGLIWSFPENLTCIYGANNTLLFPSIGHPNFRYLKMAWLLFARPWLHKCQFMVNIKNIFTGLDFITLLNFWTDFQFITTYTHTYNTLNICLHTHLYSYI